MGFFVFTSYYFLNFYSKEGNDIKTFDELPLVLQLQYLAQKTDSNIEELLRRSKLVAMKLKLVDFEDWCTQELLGYYKKGATTKDLPDYRILRGSLHLVNPYIGLVPFHFEDEKTNDVMTLCYIREPVGNILNILNKDSDHLEMKLTPKKLSYLYSIQDIQLEPKLKITNSQVENILTHVRNTIFNWSIDLERNGIVGEGMQFTIEEKETAMNNTTYHINNMQGVAGQVKDSSVTQNNQMIVNQMDLPTLLNTLKCVGVNENDLQELQIALIEDEQPSLKDNFGIKVSKWYGKMISKAAEGSWEIAIGTAANLLTQSLNSFYGLS